MKLPIRLNRAGWPASFARLRVSYDDPRPLTRDLCALSPDEFSVAVSRLQFGITFKTTRPGRHGHSDRFLLETYRGAKPVILDVGASDGSTSLDLIRALGDHFTSYFVTDLNLSVRYGSDRCGVAYFLDQTGACILRASKRFLVYADVSGARAPLPWLVRRLLAGYRTVVDWRELPLIQPELLRLAKTDQRVTVRRYDVFTPWDGRSPDVIKVGCLLTSEYFSAVQMREALRVQYSNLAPDGRLLLVSEDSGIEKFSVFRKASTGFQLEHTHAGGAKAAPYIP
jgi:hypothetical protein